MDNLNEFKAFLKTIPSIKEDVTNHKYTWQQVYEIYTLYGSDDTFFDVYKHQKEATSFVDIIKNIDFDALSSSMQSLERVLTMVSSLMVKNQDQEHWYDEK